jgi:hypothetical protein
MPPNFSWEWTDEDMRDFAIASLRHFESQHPDEDWGEDFTSPGEPKCSSQET